jgi:hypothetical protein
MGDRNGWSNALARRGVTGFLPIGQVVIDRYRAKDM